jgi:purine-cytosine permease-like protein
MSHTQELPDAHQTYWQLAAIQLSGWTSLPILATSLLLLQTNSFLGSILTLIVGNAVLWFIRLGLIAMSHSKRQSTLDISREYLSDFGAFFISVLLLLSTYAWYLTQTTTASSTLIRLFSLHESPQIDQFTQMSVFLGILSAFLCMQGMPLLRKISSFCFPILILLFMCLLFTLPAASTPNLHATSLSGLGLVLATNLGITSDFPTFFRHSKSWEDSIKALTIVQIFSLAIAICSLYFGSIIHGNIEISARLALQNPLLRFSLLGFVFLSVICANVANVYSASVGWEVLAPKALIGRKEYLILGLILTSCFILFAKIIPTEFLLSWTDASLVNLTLVLIVGYILLRLSKSFPSKQEQMIYLFSWALASLLNFFHIAKILPTTLSNFSLSLVSIVLPILLFRLLRRIFWAG